MKLIVHHLRAELLSNSHVAMENVYLKGGHVMGNRIALMNRMKKYVVRLVFRIFLSPIHR